MDKVTSLIGIRKTPRKVLLICLLLLLAAIGLGCASDSESLEEKAQSIDRLLMCPVCPAETIDQSQAEISLQMRAIVRQKLEAGDDEREILDFFAARYGESVLAKPPQEGFNIVVWIVPPIAIVAGFGLFWLAAHKLGRKDRSESDFSVDMDELRPYLREVNQEYLAFQQAYPGRSASRKDERPPAKDEES